MLRQGEVAYPTTKFLYWYDCVTLTMSAGGSRGDLPEGKGTFVTDGLGRW
jgi:hypothetical protein